MPDPGVRNVPPPKPAVRPPKGRALPADRFLDAVKTSKDDKDPYAVRLGTYKIDARQWAVWAAAAGLPNAKWEDKKAQEIVAAYAARTLYDRFENWGLVAIGWRYGAGTAAKIADFYGDTPAGDILNKMLGKGGAAFVSYILNAMSKVEDDPDAPLPPPPSFPRGGSIDLEFKTEEDDRPEEEAPRGSDPARLALLQVLEGMANATAGGQRMAIEDVEVPDLAEEEVGGVTPVTTADSDRMQQEAGG